MYEEGFHLIEHYNDAADFSDIALAGGCAMISVPNGKIRRATHFRRV
jgi:carbamoyltransferase